MNKDNLLSELRAGLSPEKLAMLEKLKSMKTEKNSSQIPKRLEQGPVPLSFSQQRLWFLDQLVPNNPAYNVVMAFHSSGKLNIDILQQSINEIVKRHESLRTVFQNIDGQAFQVILPELTVTLPVIDLTGYEKEERENQFRKMAKEEARYIFDLSEGPLLRITLFVMDKEKYIFLMNMHHIIIDAWSMGVFFRELMTVYTAFSQGKPSPLPEQLIQFADFSTWQRQWLKGEVLESQISYWKEKLGNGNMGLELPADRQRPPIQTFQGGNFRFELPQSLSESIMALSQQQGSTLYMVLLTALKVLISRYTGQKEVVIGSPIANRNRVEVENLIGFFVNTLVLKTDLEGDPSFEELLKRVREVCNSAYKHQDIPFELLVDMMQSERDMSHNPLFQVCFVLQNTPKPVNMLEISLDKVEEIRNDTSKFDLWIQLIENDGVLNGEVEYNSSIFNESTIKRFIKSYEILLQGIVDYPNEPISKLPVLSGEERHKLLVEWNDTVRNYPEQGMCLHRLVEDQVQRTPDATAVIFEGEKITYRELNRRANQLANYLTKIGAAPEMLIGICMERSLEMVIGLLGIIKSGGAYVPLDPGYPYERLSFMVEDSSTPILLTQARLLELLPKNDAKVICLDSDWESIEKESTEFCCKEVKSDNLAYMIYTSGSTGKPKGAMNTHKGIVNRILWMQEQYRLNPDDRVLQKTPFSFDVSVWEFFWPLITGACMVLARPEGHKDAFYLAQLIQQERVTTLHFVPSMLQAFLEEDEVLKCKTLKRVICSGEALSYTVQQRFFQRIDAELHNLYGPTEAAVDVTYWKCIKDDEKRSVPIGKPVANTQIYILDEHLNPTPVGVPGELHIGGVQVARGYYKREELTKEKFIANPFSAREGDRLYKTGDLARYLPDGNIEFLGRIDSQVKVRGFRIELGEIEAVTEEHPAVQKAVVQARSFDNMPDQKQLVAYVIPDPNAGKTVLMESGDKIPDVQVSEWQQVFDKAYDDDNTMEEDFNIVSWNSSYNGLPLSADEMRVWVDTTVERILALKPKRVLEIGCGTGLLLSRIAPHCEEYWGTDFSTVALDYVMNHLVNRRKELSHVKLEKRNADDFKGLDKIGFDVIVINSVVQYFPDAHYLLNVLKNAVKIMAGNGAVFIGDVRNYALLETFMTDVELEKSPQDLSVKQFKSRLEKRIRQEQELVIAPEFFYGLQKELPRIKYVDVQLKKSKYSNELTKFRYDVILHIDKNIETVKDLYWVDYKKDDYGINVIRLFVENNKPDIIGITNITNGRLDSINDKLAVLKGSNCPETIGEVKQFTSNGTDKKGVLPDEWWDLGNDTGYHVDISWVEGKTDGSYKVILVRKDYIKEGVLINPCESCQKEYKQLELYANNPLMDRISRLLVPELKKYLKDRLPDYMVPSIFMLIKEVPLSSNGKLDYQRLPEPVIDIEGLEGEFEEPGTDTERLIAEVWSEVLGLEQMGIHSNFFEMGGDSIKSILVVSRLKQKGINITPQILFKYSTISELADFIAKEQEKSELPEDRGVSCPEAGEFALSGLDSSQIELIRERFPDMEDCYPLTAMQDSMLYQRINAPVPGLNVVHHAFIIKGRHMDFKAFEKAWQYVINHFTALRTSFMWKGLKKPVQILHKSVDIQIENGDWRSVSQPEQEEKLNDYIQKFRKQGFDLEKAPQSHVALFQLTEDSYYFIYFFNLMLQDGWSYPIVIKTLFSCYRALVEGKDLNLTPAYNYKNFIEWQQQQDLSKAEAFWKKTLAGIDLPSPALVDRKVNKNADAFPPYVQEMIIMSEDTTKAVIQLAKQHRLTPYTLLQAAWALLLYKESSREDLVFGNIFSGRGNALEEIEHGVGLFFNLLPMRVKVNPDSKLVPWLQELQAIGVETSNYEHTPIRKIYDWCNIPKEQFIFESYLVSETLPHLISIFEDWQDMGATPVDMIAQTEHALRVIVFFTDQALLVNINYYKRFYDKAKIAGMLQDLKTLLEGFVEDPNRSLECYLKLIRGNAAE